jgi:hypothetical protein
MNKELDLAQQKVRAAALAVGRNPEHCRATVIGGWWRIRRNKDNFEMGQGNSIEIAILRCHFDNEWKRIPKLRVCTLRRMIRDSIKELERVRDSGMS